MADILIRNLNPRTVARLKQSAKKHGRSRPISNSSLKRQFPSRWPEPQQPSGGGTSGSKVAPSRIVQRSSERIDSDDQIAARHRCLSRGEMD